MIALLPPATCLAAPPAPPEALDAEFLDYLLTCEAKDDDWTVVADEKLRKKAAAKEPKKPPATDDASATKEKQP